MLSYFFVLSRSATERALPSMWLNNWNKDNTIIGMWNSGQYSFTVSPTNYPGFGHIRALLDMNADQFVNDSFAFAINGKIYTDPMQYNSSHIGGAVLEPTGELWTEYTHYAVEELPNKLKIRRSYFMPPNKQFYIVRYKLSAETSCTVDLLDSISSADCTEQGIGSFQDSAAIIDQSACFHTSIAMTKADEAGFAPGDITSSDSVFNYFASQGKQPPSSTYQSKNVGYGALYKGISVTSEPYVITTIRAFGKTVSEAKAALEEATLKGADYWISETETLYSEWLAKGKQPTLEGDDLDLYKKSLLVLKSSQNPNTGAIASSTHTLYGYKTWMRDSIMSAFMLSAVGYKEEARAFYNFTFTLDRDDKGGFHTCYNTFTGEVSPFVEPQYDSVGCLLIALNYLLYIDPTQKDYIYDHIDYIRNLEEFLFTQKGPFNLGISDRAPWEESTDHFTGDPIAEQYYVWNQGLSYGGLKAAAKIENQFGETERVSSCLSRANEIQQAVLNYLWSDTNKTFYRGRWADTFVPDTRAESTILSAVFTGLVSGAKAQSALEYVRKYLETDGGISRYENDPYFYNSKWNPCGEGTSETQENMPLWPVVTGYVAWSEMALGQIEKAKTRVEWMVRVAAYGNMPIGEGVDRKDNALILPSAPDAFEHAGVYVYTVCALESECGAPSILETIQ
jgi:GH15 family glucan-1,4-alpha-glucosidase